jgi:hypothetical protein
MMERPKERPKKEAVPHREPGKKTKPSIFDNIRQLPHPVEELLGLTQPATNNLLGPVESTGTFVVTYCGFTSSPTIYAAS